MHKHLRILFVTYVRFALCDQFTVVVILLVCYSITTLSMFCLRSVLNVVFHLLFLFTMGFLFCARTTELLCVIYLRILFPSLFCRCIFLFLDFMLGRLLCEKFWFLLENRFASKLSLDVNFHP